MGAIKTHLAYISRCGALELEDERGERSLGPEALAQLVQEWRLAGSKIPWRSQRREAVNIVLAMSQDGDVAALLGAAREFASTEFARHKFAMVLHEPQTDPRSHHPHVHLVVRAQGRDGVRLNPRKADLARWRQTFADRLLERGIVVAGTRRLTRGPIAGEAGLDEPRWAPPHEHATNAAARATRAEALRAWQGIAMALARSEDPQDRTLAILTMRYLQGMPITREVAMKNLGAGKSAEREEANGRQDRGRER
jgi:hypothetical protein